jgi:hypothetical protein
VAIFVSIEIKKGDSMNRLSYLELGVINDE